MGGRYVGAAGKNRSGHDAERLDSRARVLADRALAKIKYRGGGQQLETEIQPDGSVIRCLVMKHLAVPIVRWWIERSVGGEEEQRKFFIPESYHAPFVWEPEGFVITPRSKSQATQGWGMPVRKKDWAKLDDEDPEERGKAFEPINDGKGTAYNSHHYNWPIGDGAIKQVMLNKFEHNKYPDHIFDLAWESLIEYAIEQAPDADPEAIRVFYEDFKKKFTPFGWPLFFEKNDPIIMRYHGPSKDDSDKEIVMFYGWHPKQFVQIVGAEVDSFERLKEYSWEDIEEIISWKRFEREIEEVESDKWHCHWPDEVPYEDALLLELFRLTNEARRTHSQEPLCFPLKPFMQGGANITVQQMAKHRTVAHNYEGYDEGYRGMIERMAKDGPGGDIGENSGNTPPPPSSITKEGGVVVELTREEWLDAFAKKIHEGYMNSPPHRGAILDSWTKTKYENGEAENWVRSGHIAFAAKNGTAERKGPSGPGWYTTEFDEPTSGLFTTEHFYSYDIWPQFGTMEWEGADGERVSWFAERPFRYALIRILPRVSIPASGEVNNFGQEHIWPDFIAEEHVEAHYYLRPMLFYKGRRIYFGDAYRVIGGAFCRESELFYACLFDIEQLKVLLVSVKYTLLFTRESELDFTVLQSYQLSRNDYAISCAHFSQDTTKCVFAVVSGARFTNLHYAYDYNDNPHCRVAWSNWGNILVGYASNAPSRNDPPIELPSTGSSISHIEMSRVGYHKVSEFSPRCYDQKGQKYWEYKGEGNVYADYKNNDLVFATVHLDFKSELNYVAPDEICSALDADYKMFIYSIYEHIPEDISFRFYEKTLSWGNNRLSIQYAAVGRPNWWPVSFVGRFPPLLNRIILCEFHWLDLREPDNYYYSKVTTEDKEYITDGKFVGPWLNGWIWDSNNDFFSAVRRIYHGNEAVWESEETQRAPYKVNIGNVANSAFASRQGRWSPEAPKFNKYYYVTNNLGAERHISYGWHYTTFLGSRDNALRAYIVEWIFIQEPYARQDFIYNGILDIFIPWDACGFTASDNISANNVYDFVHDRKLGDRLIGGSPSFMPWVSHDFSGLSWPAQRVGLHVSKFQHLRYKEDTLNSMQQEYWLAFVKSENDAIPNVGEAYSDRQNKQVMSVGFNIQEQAFENHDDCWLLFSSLDLKELTGIEDLANNISPLGVI